MADVWVLLLIVAFFGVCVALVRGCDVIIGSDESVETGTAAEPHVNERETAAAAR